MSMTVEIKREDTAGKKKNLWKSQAPIVFKAGRWADTTQGARTDRKEVREIEHPALEAEESPTCESKSCSLHDKKEEDRS